MFEASCPIMQFCNRKHLNSALGLTQDRLPLTIPCSGGREALCENHFSSLIASQGQREMENESLKAPYNQATLAYHVYFTLLSLFSGIILHRKQLHLMHESTFFE